MAIDKLIDYEIVRRAIENDRTAFKELMDKYRFPVQMVVRKIVFDEKEVDDLVQEAFIKAFNSISTFNFEFAFSTWLYKIATNNCIDYLRKRRLKTYSMDSPVKQKDGETQQEYPDVAPTIEKELIAGERSNQISKAIEELPDKYKRVIIMRHQEEMSYEDISEILELPLGTVKARIFRGRELLNKSLKDLFR
jgi:RNA polymerase sigma-70 factor (ECF subfamily)